MPRHCHRALGADPAEAFLQLFRRGNNTKSGLLNPTGATGLRRQTEICRLSETQNMCTRRGDSKRFIMSHLGLSDNRDDEDHQHTNGHQRTTHARWCQHPLPVTFSRILFLLPPLVTPPPGSRRAKGLRCATRAGTCSAASSSCVMRPAAASPRSSMLSLEAPETASRPLGRSVMVLSPRI